MNTTEEMLRTIAQDVLGTTTIRNTVKNDSEGEVVEEKFYDFLASRLRVYHHG